MGNVRYREVARKAKVGERIRIINAIASGGSYANGDELTVKSARGLRGHWEAVLADEVSGIGILDIEYVVLEPITIDGRKATVILSGQVYSTFRALANRLGFPDAAVESDFNDSRTGLQDGDVVTLLTWAAHEGHVWAVESAKGERFLINEKGLRIHTERDRIAALEARILALEERLKASDTANKATPIADHEVAEGDRVYIVDNSATNVGKVDNLRGWATVKQIDGSDDYPYRLACRENSYGIWCARKAFSLVGIAEPTPTSRESVVRQAQADVEALLNDDYPGASVWFVGSGSYTASDYCEFVVNREKRTVVALIKVIGSGLLFARGIAKCAPGDVFNEAVGKAISLRRALGLAVPDEYTGATKEPRLISEGFRVGDLVRVTGNRGADGKGTTHYFAIGETGHIEEGPDIAGDYEVRGESFVQCVNGANLETVR